MDHNRELLKGNTPTIVLAVLRDGARHGYAIAREVNRRTGDSLAFKQGTLYPVLHTLEQDGWISGAWDTEGGDRPRKIYSITENGLTELSRRKDAWLQFAEAMSRVMQGGREVPDGEPA